MSVTIETQIQEYTWDSLNKTWEQALFTWGTAGIQDIALGVSEGISIKDAKSMNYHLSTSEKIMLVDKRPSIELLCAFDESLLINETASRIFIAIRDITEQIVFEEVLSNNYNFYGDEQFSLVDDINKNIIKSNNELLNINDEFERSFNANLRFRENIEIVDLNIKEIKVLNRENIGIYDTYLKACDGVLSDIIISDKAMSFQDFKNKLNTPPSFNPFIEFKVGEYEYDEALVRIVMETNVKQTMPSITDAVMYIDIPDTDDRGEVVITDTSAATKVYFNKFYYNAPEVNVTLKGGNTGDGVLIPNIVTTEGVDAQGRYFEVELLDENWLSRKTGRISWTSKGY